MNENLFILTLKRKGKKISGLCSEGNVVPDRPVIAKGSCKLKF